MEITESKLKSNIQPRGQKDDQSQVKYVDRYAATHSSTVNIKGIVSDSLKIHNISKGILTFLNYIHPTNNNYRYF